MVARSISPVGMTSAKKRAVKGTNMPATPAMANVSTSTPLHEFKGLATRASTKMPIMSRMMALTPRNMANWTLERSTSHLMNIGSSHDVHRIDRPVATPPGNAKLTTRFKKPGIYRRVFGASARMNAGMPMVSPPI